MALQRNEVIPAQKKAGVASRTTLVTQVGNGFEYVSITPFPDWSAMDGDAVLTRALGAEGAAALNAKLRQCIQSQESYMTNRRDSLTIDAANAPVWEVAIKRFVPGKTQEALALYRAELFPAMQKAKASGSIAGSTIATRGRGALSGEFTVVTFYNKFADLNGADPLIAAMGREAYDRFHAKAQGLWTNTRTVVRRRLAELSF
jgi:hypothetical protein